MDKKENENIDDNAEQILTEKFDHNELEKNSTRLLDHDKKVGDGMSLEDIPPEFKKITQIMAMQGFSSSAQSDISTKINERHIDRILEISEKDDERRYKDSQQSRLFNLLYVLIGVGIFVFLILFLAGKNTNLLMELIKFFLPFIGGIGTGYGYKSFKDRK